MAEENTAPKEWTIILRFTTDPWGMVIEGDIANGDMALAMLDQARRKVENDMRLQLAIEGQAAFKKRMAEEERVANILGRPRPQ